jgi:hypothetical protein
MMDSAKNRNLEEGQAPPPETPKAHLRDFLGALLLLLVSVAFAIAASEFLFGLLTGYGIPLRASLPLSWHSAWVCSAAIDIADCGWSGKQHSLAHKLETLYRWGWDGSSPLSHHPGGTFFSARCRS